MTTKLSNQQLIVQSQQTKQHNDSDQCHDQLLTQNEQTIHSLQTQVNGDLFIKVYAFNFSPL